MWTLLIQHVFTKVLKSSMLLASTGVIISTALLGVIFLLFFHEVPAELLTDNFACCCSCTVAAIDRLSHDDISCYKWITSRCVVLH